MKPSIVFIALALLSAPVFADDIRFNDHTVEINNDRNVPRIVKMVSPTYQAAGSVAQIIQKAQGCVARNLTNDEVSTSGSSASGFFGAIAGQGHNVNSSVAGGSVIELSDPENGLLTANSRADFKFMLISFSVRSRFVVEAKEGRYRITQSSLESLQTNTGSMRNSGYSQLIRRKGTGWDKALAAATEAEKKVVDCMAGGPDESW